MSKKDQQKKCKLLCGKPALKCWQAADMCKECYKVHQRAMDNVMSTGHF